LQQQQQQQQEQQQQEQELLDGAKAGDARQPTVVNSRLTLKTAVHTAQAASGLDAPG
jgi:hypothetical protein